MALKNIYYVTDEYNTNLLDYLQNNINFSINKSEALTDIDNFIRIKLSMISKYDYIILNRSAFVNNDIDFINGLKALIKMLNENKRLIIIWKNLLLSDVDTELNCSTYSLNSIGIGNICIGNDLQELHDEINECISDSGMYRYKVNEVSSIEKKKFKATKEEPIIIGIIGITKNAGATNFAYNFTTYLKKSGGNPLLINNKEFHLLKKYIEGEEIDNIYISKDNISIAKDFPEELIYDFYIIDYGSIYNNEDLIKIKGDIENTEIKELILIGSIDMLAIDNFKTNYRFFETYNPYVLINYNHLKEDESKTEKFISEIKHYAYFKRHRDFVDLATNKTIFLDISQKYQI